MLFINFVIGRSHLHFKFLCKGIINRVSLLIDVLFHFLLSNLASGHFSVLIKEFGTYSHGFELFDLILSIFTSCRFSHSVSKNTHSTLNSILALVSSVHACIEYTESESTEDHYDDEDIDSVLSGDGGLVELLVDVIELFALARNFVLVVVVPILDCVRHNVVMLSTGSPRPI